MIDVNVLGSYLRVSGIAILVAVIGNAIGTPMSQVHIIMVVGFVAYTVGEGFGIIHAQNFTTANEKMHKSSRLRTGGKE